MGNLCDYTVNCEIISSTNTQIISVFHVATFFHVSVSTNEIRKLLPTQIFGESKLLQQPNVFRPFILSSCILIKDEPINCSLSNQCVTSNSCHGSQPSYREVWFVFLCKCCASKSFARKVIYRWNWIVAAGGHCLVHLAKRRGSTDIRSWWMLCFPLFSQSAWTIYLLL